MAICKRSFFDKNPHAVWEWHLDFYKIQEGKQANPGHVAVREFQEFCVREEAMGIESMLMTQNIDDLHVREIKES